jgi:ABC-type antimicrobial peptide transport system permease subunit
MLQNPDYLGWNNAIVRTPGEPVQLARALRQRIESLGREYPLSIETVGDERGRSLLPERLLALLTNFFGVLGLLLAAVGLYGLLSYSVARRTGEIGVRVALGATSRIITRMFLSEVAALLAIGLAVGLALALAGGRALAATLYGLSAHDPGTLLIAAAVLILIALAAGIKPALRAARIDPAIALRHE